MVDRLFFWGRVSEALKMLASGLGAAGLATKDLARRPSTAPCMVAMASMMWEKTTVSQSWIAEKLEMKNPANLSRVIHRMNMEKIAQKVEMEMGSVCIFFQK